MKSEKIKQCTTVQSNLLFWHTWCRQAAQTQSFGLRVDFDKKFILIFLALGGDEIYIIDTIDTWQVDSMN